MIVKQKTRTVIMMGLLLCLQAYSTTTQATQIQLREDTVFFAAKKTPQTKPEDHHGEVDAYDEVKKFLSQKKKTDLLVIMGANGSGKTTLAKKIYQELHQEFIVNNKKPFPRFVDLNEENSFDEFEKFLSQKSTKKKDRFVFILDGCEKLPKLRSGGNLYERLKLESWNALTLVTCRSEALSHSQTEAIFRVKRNELNSLYLAPWTKNQIEEYLRDNKDGMRKFNRLNLFNLPLGAVKIALEIGQKKNGGDDFIWHHKFVQHWLQKAGFKKSEVMGVAQELALTMFEHGQDKALPRTGGDSKHPIWGDFFKKKKRRLLLHAPIVRWGDQDYQFLFPSLKHYFIAKGLLNEIKLGHATKENSAMSTRFLNGSHMEILTMLAQKTKRNQKAYEEKLMKIVRNKDNPIAAANALSILGKADMLKGKRLQGIQVSGLARGDNNSFTHQGPYLKGVDLTGCDFTGADMRYAKLQNATLRQCNFNKANLIWADLSNVTAENTIVTKAKTRGVTWPSKEGGFIGRIRGNIRVGEPNQNEKPSCCHVF